MNRSDLIDIAIIRLKEADTLLKNGNYDGAYYLSGYVVECGLKACVAKQTKKYDFPRKKKEIERIYSHDLTKLLAVAGLNDTNKDDRKTNPRLEVNWSVGFLTMIKSG